MKQRTAKVSLTTQIDERCFGARSVRHEVARRASTGIPGARQRPGILRYRSSDFRNEMKSLT